MKAIYFSGKGGGGKTAAALGVGLKLKDEGFKVSYFKPIGVQRGTVKKDDDDVVLMRDVLGLPFSCDTISPVPINAHYLTARFTSDDHNYNQKIDNAFKRCSEGYDVVLVDGSIEPYVGFNQGIDDFSLASRFGASVIPIIKADDDYRLDENLMFLKMWHDLKVPVIGCIFNNVKQTQWNKSVSVYKPMLEENGCHVLGLIPRQAEISAPTVFEFQDVLNGEILVGEDHMDNLVEEVVIGSMTAESALSYLRRAPNKALITGGDRSNLALAALETSTSAIIFTGGLYPDVRVLARAEEKEVPVILVHQDTFTTLENLHSIYRSIDPKNKEAIKLVKSNIEKNIQWDVIVKYLKS